MTPPLLMNRAFTFSLLVFAFLLAAPVEGAESKIGARRGLRSTIAWIMMVDPSVPGARGDMEAVQQLMATLGADQRLLSYVVPPSARPSTLDSLPARIVTADGTRITFESSATDIPELMTQRGKVIERIESAGFPPELPPEIIILHLSSHGHPDGSFTWGDGHLSPENLRAALLGLIDSYGSDQAILLLVDTCHAAIAQDIIDTIDRSDSIRAIYTSAPDEPAWVFKLTSSEWKRRTRSWPRWSSHRRDLKSHVERLFPQNRRYSAGTMNFVVALLGAAGKRDNDLDYSGICEFMEAAGDGQRGSGATSVRCFPETAKETNELVFARFDPAVSIEYPKDRPKAERRKSLYRMKNALRSSARRAGLRKISFCAEDDDLPACSNPWVRCGIAHEAAIAGLGPSWVASCARGHGQRPLVSEGASQPALGLALREFREAPALDIFVHGTTQDLIHQSENDLYLRPALAALSSDEPRPFVVLLDVSPSTAQTDINNRARLHFFEHVIAPSIASGLVSELYVFPLQDVSINPIMCFDLNRAEADVHDNIEQARKCYEMVLELSDSPPKGTNLVQGVVDISEHARRRSRPSPGIFHGKEIRLFFLTDGMQQAIVSNCHKFMTVHMTIDPSDPELAVGRIHYSADTPWQKKRNFECRSRHLRRAARTLFKHATVDPYVILLNSRTRSGSKPLAYSLLSFDHRAGGGRQTERLTKAGGDTAGGGALQRRLAAAIEAITVRHVDLQPEPGNGVGRVVDGQRNVIDAGPVARQERIAGLEHHQSGAPDGKGAMAVAGR